MTAIKALLAASSLGGGVRHMKLIIAGSRDLVVDDYEMQRGIDAMLDQFGIMPSEIVSGCARGPDRAGERWAQSNGPHTADGIKLTRFPVTPADWKRHGKRAGILRNTQMADYADALLAFWDGSSRGTANMIEQMLERSKPVHVAKMRPAGYVKSVLTCNECGDRDCAVGRGVCEPCFVARTGP